MEMFFLPVTMSVKTVFKLSCCFNWVGGRGKSFISHWRSIYFHQNRVCLCVVSCCFVYFFFSFMSFWLGAFVTITSTVRTLLQYWLHIEQSLAKLEWNDRHTVCCYIFFSSFFLHFAQKYGLIKTYLIMKERHLCQLLTMHTHTYTYEHAMLLKSLGNTDGTLNNSCLCWTAWIFFFNGNLLRLLLFFLN